MSSSLGTQSKLRRGAKLLRLSALEEGEKFRAAHPLQVSANGIEMPREQVFRVDRIYPTPPHIRVCYLTKSKDVRPRTLYPDAPVLRPSTPLPTRERVEAFLIEAGTTRMVVGYRICYDGTADLRLFLQPQEARVFNRLYLTGKSEFSMPELLTELVRFDPSAKLTGNALFYHYAPHLREVGLIQPILDEGPSMARTLSEVVGIR